MQTFGFLFALKGSFAPSFQFTSQPPLVTIVAQFTSPAGVRLVHPLPPTPNPLPRGRGLRCYLLPLIVMFITLVTPIAVKQLAIATFIPSRKNAQTIAEINHRPRKTNPFSTNCCPFLFI